MEVPEHRKWMDHRVGPDRSITDEFFAGIQEFVNFACAQDRYKIDGVIRCPCKKCKCLKFEVIDEVQVHLCRKGFMQNYYYWTSYGEAMPPNPPVIMENSYYGDSGQRENFNNYE